MLHFDHAEPRLDRHQPGADGARLILELDPAQPEHAAQLLRTDLLEQDATHLIEGEAEVLESNEAIEDVQLLGRIGAVAGPRIHVIGPQQPELVVVTQHPHRHLTESSEVRDVHDSVLPPHTV